MLWWALSEMTDTSAPVSISNLVRLPLRAFVWVMVSSSESTQEEFSLLSEWVFWCSSPTFADLQTFLKWPHLLHLWHTASYTLLLLMRWGLPTPPIDRLRGFTTIITSLLFGPGQALLPDRPYMISGCTHHETSSRLVPSSMCLALTPCSILVRYSSAVDVLGFEQEPTFSATRSLCTLVLWTLSFLP